MRFIQTFDPTSATSGNIKIGSGDPGQKVLLYNESAVTIQLDFQNGNTSYLHAWEANYWTLPYPITEITWSTVRSLSGAGQAPASEVDVLLYGTDEPIEGTYPAQLNRLANTGNVQAVTSSASQITNDGNAASTAILEATQTGSSGSNVSMDNSGNLILKQYVSATLTQIFKVLAGAGNGASNVFLSDAAHQCEVLGNLLVDLALTVTGNATVNGNLTVNGSFSAGTLQATSIVNDGNATNTQVIEAKQSGSSGSNVSIDNSGNVAIKQYVSATLTTLFQTLANVANGTSNVKLSDASHQCEVLGNLLVDAALSVSGNTTLSGNLAVTGTSTLTGALTAGSTITATNVSDTSAYKLVDHNSNTKDILYANGSNNLCIQMCGTSKIFFCDNTGAHLASIDTTGQLRLKAALTQNTTP